VLPALLRAWPSAAAPLEFRVAAASQLTDLVRQRGGTYVTSGGATCEQGRQSDEYNPVSQLMCAGMRPDSHGEVQAFANNCVSVPVALLHALGPTAIPA